MGATYIVGGARTPIGKFRGALASLDAPALGAHAIAASLDGAHLAGSDVERVIVGHVLQAGLGQNTARQAAVYARIPLDVPALTLNSVCLSGMAAVIYGDLLIRSGECHVVVAAGMESMTNAPHVLAGSRAGLGYGQKVLTDVTQVDGLTDAFDHLGMGDLTEVDTKAAGWTRDDLDAFAVLSHQHAHQAVVAGVRDLEIVPITITDRRGSSTVAADEGIRPDTSAASLAKLRPAFAADGLLTAATSSPISDGGAAVVLMSEKAVARFGVTPWARIVACASVAGPDTSLLRQPGRATAAALDKAAMRVSDVDRFEFNEAFAPVALQSARDLSVPLDRVNVDGGAIALGHPLGMSGARLVLALARAVASGRSRVGVAALCGGGGQGDAVLIQHL